MALVKKRSEELRKHLVDKFSLFVSLPFVCLVKLFLAGRACPELMILPIFGIFWPPADRICVPSKDSTVARNALSGRGDLWL